MSYAHENMQFFKILIYFCSGAITGAGYVNHKNAMTCL